MKFTLAALILATLLSVGGYVLLPPTTPPDPDLLGHYSGDGLDLILEASTETPGEVLGRARFQDGWKWMPFVGVIRWRTLRLEGAERLTGRFHWTDAGAWTLDVEWPGRVGPKMRLARLFALPEVRFERPGLVVKGVHPELVSGNPFLRRAVNEGREEAIDRCRKEFQDYGQELEDIGPTAAPWDYSETWFVIVRTDDLVSMMGFVNYYSGGAHPNLYYRTRTTWVTPGGATEARLADLFNPCTAWLDEVSTRVLQQLRNKGASSVVDGQILALDERDLACWVLSKRGIEFHFAPYWVGCYAEGAYEAELIFDDIRPLLNPMGPAASLLH